MDTLLTDDQAKVLVFIFTLVYLKPKFETPEPHKDQVFKLVEKAVKPLARPLSEDEKIQLTLDWIRFKYGAEMAAKATLDYQKQGKLKRMSKGYRRFLQLLQILNYMFSMYPEYMVTLPLLLLFLIRLLKILKNNKLTREERESLRGLIIGLFVWLLAIISPILLPVVFYLLVFLFKELYLTGPLKPYSLEDILE